MNIFKHGALPVFDESFITLICGCDRNDCQRIEIRNLYLNTLCSLLQLYDDYVRRAFEAYPHQLRLHFANDDDNIAAEPSTNTIDFSITITGQQKQQRNENQQPTTSVMYNLGLPLIAGTRTHEYFRARGFYGVVLSSDELCSLLQIKPTIYCTLCRKNAVDDEPMYYKRYNRFYTSPIYSIVDNRRVQFRKGGEYVQYINSKECRGRDRFTEALRIANFEIDNQQLDTSVADEAHRFIGCISNSHLYPITETLGKALFDMITIAVTSNIQIVAVQRQVATMGRHIRSGFYDRIWNKKKSYAPISEEEYDRQYVGGTSSATTAQRQQQQTTDCGGSGAESVRVGQTPPFSSSSSLRSNGSVCQSVRHIMHKNTNIIRSFFPMMVFKLIAFENCRIKMHRLLYPGENGFLSGEYTTDTDNSGQGSAAVLGTTFHSPDDVIARSFDSLLDVLREYVDTEMSAAPRRRTLVFYGNDFGGVDPKAIEWWPERVIDAFSLIGRCTSRYGPIDYECFGDNIVMLSVFCGVPVTRVINTTFSLTPKSMASFSQLFGGDRIPVNQYGILGVCMPLLCHSYYPKVMQGIANIRHSINVSPSNVTVNLGGQYFEVEPSAPYEPPIGCPVDAMYMLKMRGKIVADPRCTEDGLVVRKNLYAPIVSKMVRCIRFLSATRGTDIKVTYVKRTPSVLEHGECLLSVSNAICETKKVGEFRATRVPHSANVVRVRFHPQYNTYDRVYELHDVQMATNGQDIILQVLYRFNYLKIGDKVVTLAGQKCTVTHVVDDLEEGVDFHMSLSSIKRMNMSELLFSPICDMIESGLCSKHVAQSMYGNNWLLIPPKKRAIMHEYSRALFGNSSTFTLFFTRTDKTADQVITYTSRDVEFKLRDPFFNSVYGGRGGSGSMSFGLMNLMCIDSMGAITTINHIRMANQSGPYECDSLGVARIPHAQKQICSSLSQNNIHLDFLD